MNKHPLLIAKRYIIIADYPQPEGRVGDILHMSSIPEFDNSEYYDKYPHLFRKLNWWEHLHKDDRPKYLKNVHTKEVYKIDGFPANEGNNHVLLSQGYKKSRKHLSNFIPATQEEYTTQQHIVTDYLLIPRYKLIANFPGCNLPIGHIYSIIADEQTTKKWCELKDIYPQIYQKLEWWQDRRPDEIPTYAKYANNPKYVVRILKQHPSIPTKVFCISQEGYEGWEFLTYLLPAKEEDFLKKPD